MVAILSEISLGNKSKMVEVLMEIFYAHANLTIGHKLDQPFVDSFQLLFIHIYFKFILYSIQDQ